LQLNGEQQQQGSALPDVTHGQGFTSSQNPRVSGADSAVSTAADGTDDVGTAAAASQGGCFTSSQDSNSSNSNSSSSSSSDGQASYEVPQQQQQQQQHEDQVLIDVGCEEQTTGGCGGCSNSSLQQQQQQQRPVAWREVIGFAFPVSDILHILVACVPLLPYSYSNITILYFYLM
jgi:hypothetical protein